MYRNIRRARSVSEKSYNHVFESPEPLCLGAIPT